jgi:hypothetical protein
MGTAFGRNIMADEDLIRERAYALWEQSGRPEGSADDFWNEARQQLEAQELSPIESDALSGGLESSVAPPMPKNHEESE